MGEVRDEWEGWIGYYEEMEECWWISVTYPFLYHHFSTKGPVLANCDMRQFPLVRDVRRHVVSHRLQCP